MSSTPRTGQIPVVPALDLSSLPERASSPLDEVAGRTDSVAADALAQKESNQAGAHSVELSADEGADHIVSVSTDIAHQGIAVVPPEMLAWQGDVEVPVGLEGREVVEVVTKKEYPKPEVKIFNVANINTTRKVGVEKDKFQEQLNETFADIRALLNETAEMDLFIDVDIDGQPVIHTFGADRVNADGTTRIEHYDLLIDGELKRLLSDNGVTEDFDTIKEQLSILGKKLDKIIDKISPRSAGTRQIWSPDHIGNLSAFNLMHTQSPHLHKVLSDKDYLKNSIARKMAKETIKDGIKEESVFVDATTKCLNDVGIKTMKQIIVATELLDQIRNTLHKSSSVLINEKNRLQKEGRNVLEVHPDIEVLQGQIASINRVLKEINDTSPLSLAWIMMEKNRLDLVGNDPESDDNYYEQRVKAVEESFNANVRENSRSRSWKTLWLEKKEANLGRIDLQGGLEHGVQFFHEDKGKARIRNILFHEKQNASVCRDLPGVNLLIQEVLALVEYSGSDYKLSRLGEHLPDKIKFENETVEYNLRDEVRTAIPKRVMESLDAFNQKTRSGEVKNWNEMTPQAAAEFINEKGINALRWPSILPNWRKRSWQTAGA